MNIKGYSPEQNGYIETVIANICETYEDGQVINHREGNCLPRHQEIVETVELLLEIVFPGFRGNEAYSICTIKYSIGDIVTKLYSELKKQITKTLLYLDADNECDICEIDLRVHEAVKAVLDRLPQIREAMKLDVQAAFAGDPAAKSTDEIVVSYPGVKAITVQRVAHILYQQNIPLIPRMMTEYVHSVTGIDIHPGAELGKGLFIDHGTGVVIGETAVIGDSVKIYQGVTLGALSFPKDDSGKVIKGKKRHPTLENNVTIYAGATVLGDITIGEGALIGGNAWLAEDVAPRHKVVVKTPENSIINAPKNGVNVE